MIRGGGAGNIRWVALPLFPVPSGIVAADVPSALVVGAAYYSRAYGRLYRLASIPTRAQSTPGEVVVGEQDQEAERICGGACCPPSPLRGRQPLI